MENYTIKERGHMNITQIIQVIAVGIFIIIIVIISAIKINRNVKTYEVKGDAIRRLDLKKINQGDSN
jgi:hypothetical protein